jgi:hypothetical protein
MNPKIIELAQIFNADLLAPNDNAPDGQVQTVWNLPRDMKTDVAVVLQTAISSFGLDIVVIKNGIFEQAKLRNPDTTKTRPVITVARTQDSAQRMGVGELDGNYQKLDPRLIATAIDGTALLADGGSATVYNQASDVTVDVTIYDLNEMRADQTYLFVKTIMFAAERTFTSLGYLKPPIRTGGSDGGSILDSDGGPKFCFERTLTYQAEHLDYIGAVDTLAHLIAIQQDTEPFLDPDRVATETATLS